MKYKLKFFSFCFIAAVLAAHPARGEITSKAYVDRIVATKVDSTALSAAIASAIVGKEDIQNKVVSISSASTNTQYPSASAVYTFGESKVSKTGDETISGVKTFTGTVIVPTQPIPTP